MRTITSGRERSRYQTGLLAVDSLVIDSTAGGAGRIAGDTMIHGAAMPHSRAQELDGTVHSSAAPKPVLTITAGAMRGTDRIESADMTSPPTYRGAQQ